MLKYIVLITKKQPGILNELEKQCTNQGVSFFYVLPEFETKIRETLYITDDREIFQGLWEEGASVLVWLHEENKGENFTKAEYLVENIEEIDFIYLERIYRRLRKIPWIIKETKRCIIREMTEEDLEQLYEIYRGKSITQYMEGLYEEKEEEREFIRSYIESAYKFYGYGTWVIEDKLTKKLIGRVGFNLREGYEEPELGFVIAEQYQRQGYAYECCSAVIENSREEFGFEMIQALVKEGNYNSARLCLKLGFKETEPVFWEEEKYLRYIKFLGVRQPK